MRKQGVILGGPTGVGKTSLSLQLAKNLQSDIISADSAQVYRDLNIGTAKIKPEEMRGVRHHLLDVQAPNEKYSVGQYEKAVNEILAEKSKQGENILLVGGTGLYLDAVSEGLSSLPEANLDLRKLFAMRTAEELYQELLEKDPLSAERIHPNNRVRVERALEVFLLTGQSFAILSRQNQKGNSYSFTKFALEREREHLYERINGRVEQMMEEGLLEEVERVYRKNPKLASLKIIGYDQMIEYLDGFVSLEKAVENLKRDSRHYAKRQFTWFRQKKDYIWFNLDRMTEEEILEEMNNILRNE